MHMRVCVCVCVAFLSRASEDVLAVRVRCRMCMGAGVCNGD